MLKKNVFSLYVLCAMFISLFYINGCDKAPVKGRDSAPEVKIGWEEDFSKPSGSKSIPDNWAVKGKPGTPVSKYSIKNENGTSYMNIMSDKASGNLITKLNDVDLKETPYLEWKWRVLKLPANADARTSALDDQAIAIYVGTGSLLSKKSIAYHWDTETPKGMEGSSTYGGGTVKVKWITLRNKSDGINKWVVEKRNCAEDFKKAWGFIPENIYLSVSGNSQYTNSEAIADLDWIRFSSNQEK